MIKILIIATKGMMSGDDASYSYLLPLGLGYISASLKAAGHTVHCLNMNHCAGSTDDLIRNHFAEYGEYDIVCTGGLSTAYIQIKRVVGSVRRYGNNAKIILGGGLISSEPNLMFEDILPDYIVIGEGEQTIVELLTALQHGANLHNIKGIGFMGENRNLVLTASRKPLMDLDTLPWPNFDGFDFETQLEHMRPTDQFFYDIYDHPRVYPIITSRSCPYLCTFCFHPIGNHYRQRSMDAIMQEIETNVRRYRINIISIYDELFSHSKERVIDFCARMKKFRSTLPWECSWGCQMRVDGVNDNILELMRDAGCYMVSYGFESYSEPVLKSMRKHILPAQIEKAVITTLAHNISIQGNFIFGDRAETLNTAQETLRFARKHPEAGITLYHINPYPGTALYTYCVERGIIKDKLDFIENHIFDHANMSETMTKRESSRLYIEIIKTRLLNYITAVPVAVDKMRHEDYSIIVECPHCHELIVYGNYFLASEAYFNIMTYCRKCRKRFFIISANYQTALRLMRLIFKLTPPPVMVAAFSIIQKMRPWIVKRLAQRKGNSEKLAHLLSPIS